MENGVHLEHSGVDIFMLKPKFTPQCLLFLFISCIALSATTVVTAVTRHGIVVASDSGEITHTGDFAPVGTGSTVKMFIVQHHIVIVNVGTSSIFAGVGNQKVVPYEFLGWIKKINDNLASNIPLDEFVGIIEKQSAATFAGFDVVLGGDVMKTNDPTEYCRTFVQYVIAGYDGIVPKIYIVQFDINWETKKLSGPKRILLHPSPQTKGDFTLYSFGIKQAITDLKNRKSYAYQQASLRCKAFRNLMAEMDISLDETVSVAKTLVGIEEDVNPNEVMGAIANVKLFPDGTVGDLKIDPTNTLAKQPSAIDKHKQNQQH